MYEFDAPDFTGKTVDNGRLRLVELLGRGTYGVVYRAVDDTSAASSSFCPEPKQYAVKIMAKVDPQTHRAECQLHELCTHMSVEHHPNIVSLHRFFECEVYMYLVLDLCPGGTLMKALDDRLLYARNDALVKSVFLQILDAVEFCHDNGVYHRDLKPDNILVNEDGTEIKLADFGLSTTSMTSLSFCCGSYQYMAPECIGIDYDNKPYSPKACDIWSLGIVLTNLVAGRNFPWTLATSSDRNYLDYLVDHYYLRDVFAISKETNAILHGMLNPDPIARWTLQELRLHIEQVETFFMSEEEIAASSKTVKLAAAAYSPPSNIEALAHLQSAVCLGDARALLAEDQLSSSCRSCPPRARAVSQSRKSNNSGKCFVIVGSGGLSSWGSAEESEGPITPETHAQDPVKLAEVPELTDSEKIGELAGLPEQEQKNRLPPVQVPAPLVAV